MRGFCIVLGDGVTRTESHLLLAIADELQDMGVRVDLSEGRFPQADPGTVFIAMPQDVVGSDPIVAKPSKTQSKRTIWVNDARPGHPQLRQILHFAASNGSLMDTGIDTVRRLKYERIPVEHFQLGYSKRWDHMNSGQPPSRRPLNTLFMGASVPRRNHLLAHFGRHWVGTPYEIRLYEVPEAPSGPSQRPSDSDRTKALLSSMTLLNIHRTVNSEFEWLRVLEAICSGCVVVSEPSTGFGPLEPGEHIFFGQGVNLPHLVNQLAQQVDRLDDTSKRAYQFVKDELPMRPAVEKLASMGERLTSRTGRTLHVTIPETAVGTEPEPIRVSGPEVVKDRFERIVRQSLKKQALESTQIKQHLQRIEARITGVELDETAKVVETAAYPVAEPRITIMMSIYNPDQRLLEAIRSVALSNTNDYEIVIADDGSSKKPFDAIERELARYPWVPAVVYARPVNAGVMMVRNWIINHARGKYIFNLDQDNLVYPNCLKTLSEALEGEPGAAFAYGILEGFNRQGPVDLISHLPWSKKRLGSGNWIDAMTMMRRDILLEVGGFSEDLRTWGYEDFELWCHFADRGYDAVFIPSIVGRYRRSEYSQLAAYLQIDDSVAWSILRDKYPQLL